MRGSHNYFTESKMPYKNVSIRRQAVAASMRKNRQYNAAIAAGHPQALEAERQRDLARNSMRPAHEFRARLDTMPREQRQPFKDEYARILAQCQSIDPDAAAAEYRRLRALVIAEAEFARLT